MNCFLSLGYGSVLTGNSHKTTTTCRRLMFKEFATWIATSGISSAAGAVTQFTWKYPDKSMRYSLVRRSKLDGGMISANRVGRRACRQLCCCCMTFKVYIDNLGGRQNEESRDCGSGVTWSTGALRRDRPRGPREGDGRPDGAE